MGLTGAGLNRFRNRVDDALLDAFPCTLIVGGVPIECSGPGGRAASDILDAGESMEMQVAFRLPKTAPGVSSLKIGSPLAWQIPGTPPKSVPLEIVEIQERPHEDRLGISCKRRRV